MKNKFTLLMPLIWLTPLAAQAHPGHGLPGFSHWHATDVLGYVLMAAVAAAAVWWLRRK